MLLLLLLVFIFFILPPKLKEIPLLNERTVTVGSNHYNG